MQLPTRICGQQNAVVAPPHVIRVSTYLWTQRVVVVDARFLICVDASALKLEESLHGDVHEGKGGDCNSIGARDIGGRCAEPRCNGGIDPVRLPYGQTIRVLLLKVVPATVSSGRAKQRLV